MATLELGLWFVHEETIQVKEKDTYFGNIIGMIFCVLCMRYKNCTWTLNKPLIGTSSVRKICSHSYACFPRCSLQLSHAVKLSAVIILLAQSPFCLPSLIQSASILNGLKSVLFHPILIHATSHLPISISPHPSFHLHLQHHQCLCFGVSCSKLLLGFFSPITGHWSLIAKFIHFSISVNLVWFFQMISPY